MCPKLPYKVIASFLLNNMQGHVFLAAVVCALLAGARAEGDVVDLTDATFKETISKNTFVLVEFFAPCKSQK